MQRMPEKHLPYFELIESMKDDACPICVIVCKKVQGYIENLLYEGVNDPGFRRRFNHDHGFCNAHTYQLSASNDGLAMSILYKDRLEAEIAEMSAKQAEIPRQQKPSLCIVCSHIKEIEQRYISIIDDHANDGEFKNHFLSSNGLCLPHVHLLASLSKSMPDWMWEFHLEKYQALLTGLTRYIDSCNASLGDKRPILDDSQKLIWQKAVAMLHAFQGKI